MTGRKPGSKRRTVLRNLASIATGSALFAGTVGATSKRQQKAETTEFGERVPFGQAKKVATAARQRYAHRAYQSWKGATVGKPRKFFTKIKLNTRKQYVPTAYVFPVRSSHSPVGYLTISARKKWSPVLEASTADPPGLDEHSVKNMARQQGERPTGTYLYRGATTYSVELESGKQLYLNTGLKEGMTAETPQLEVEKHGESVESQWSTADTIPTGDVQIQGSYGIVNGIEPWDANGGSGSLSGSDEGGADTSVPELYGNTPDKWEEWDGCAPFAGAQILMYHEGISVSDIEQREEIADRLHVLMETDPDGWTGYRMPRKGITKYPTSEVEHDYTGHDELWLSKKMFRNEIDAERPFMLNIPSNKGVKSDEKSYTGHTVVVHGYYESDNGFDVIHYNSWNTNEHRMQFGNWPINTWGTRVVH